jgi:hypothetical protein
VPAAAGAGDLAAKPSGTQCGRQAVWASLTRSFGELDKPTCSGVQPSGAGTVRTKGYNPSPSTPTTRKAHIGAGWTPEFIAVAASSERDERIERLIWGSCLRSAHGAQLNNPFRAPWWLTDQHPTAEYEQGDADGFHRVSNPFEHDDKLSRNPAPDLPAL